jgi:hypothetical protein
MLNWVVSNGKTDIASKGHQASVTDRFVERDAIETLSKCRTLTRPHFRAERAIVFANMVAHLPFKKSCIIAVMGAILIS